jgi:sugar/nucleoside kinase (ribokinase family)
MPPQAMERLDYLAIGHITQDLLPNGDRAFGGTVTYAAQTAAALGCRTGVITSVRAGEDVKAIFRVADTNEIKLHCVSGDQTTTFENIYSAAGRIQYLYQVAAPLGQSDIPAGWERAQIAHIGPVAQEVTPEIILRFSDSLVGLTPQGWMRRWDGSGRVTPVEWPLAAQYVPLAAATIISEEDLPDEAALAQFRAWAPILVLTKGPGGCVVFMDDEMRQVPTEAVQAVEATGAGDIFAAAFLIRLHQTMGNPWEAARYANEVAGRSITQKTLAEKISAIRMHRAHSHQQGREAFSRRR